MTKTGKIIAAATATVLVGGTFWIATNTTSVTYDCNKTRVDTTFANNQICDTQKVYYVKNDSIWVDYKNPKYKDHWRTIKRKSDSLNITCRDTSVMVLDTVTYIGKCDSQQVTPKMAYGLWIQDAKLSTAEKITLCKSVGASCFKTTVNLSNYKGETQSALKQMTDAGIRSNLVVTWNAKKDGLFVRDTAAFRSKLKQFLEANKGLNFFAVIEDEVASNGFFVDNLQYYIDELKIAVEECHKYGIECTNSGDHLEYGYDIANGIESHNDNDADIRFLMAAYRTVPIDFLTLHNGEEQTQKNFDICVNTLKELSGKTKLYMNAHVFKKGDPEALKTMVKMYKDAGFLFFMPFSGDGGDVSPGFNVTGSLKLSAWGDTYKNIIFE